MSRKQLSRAQAEISEKQANLSQQITAIKVDNPELVAALNKLRESMSTAEVRERLERLSELQAKFAEIQAKQIAAETEASIKQSAFAQLQAELARAQAELARQQSLISHEESSLVTKANRKVRALLEHALSDGLAKPEP